MTLEFSLISDAKTEFFLKKEKRFDRFPKQLIIIDKRRI